MISGSSDSSFECFVEPQIGLMIPMSDTSFISHGELYLLHSDVTILDIGRNNWLSFGFQSPEEMLVNIKDDMRNSVGSTSRKAVYVPKSTSLNASSITSPEDLSSILVIEAYHYYDFATLVQIGFVDCKQNPFLPAAFVNGHKLTIEVLQLQSNSEKPKQVSSTVLKEIVQNNFNLTYDSIPNLSDYMSEEAAKNTVYQISLSSPSNQISYFLFRLNPSFCPGGYYFSNTSKPKTCMPCQYQTYSIRGFTNESTCNSCPTGASCINGELFALNGSWRSSSNSSLILDCPLPNSCLQELPGGPKQGPFKPGIDGHLDRSCAQGYIGATCSECDSMGVMDPEKKYVFLNQKCQISEEKVTFFKVTLASLSILGAAGYILANVLIQNYSANKQLKAIESGEESPSSEYISPSSILKIILNYITIIRFCLLLQKEALSWLFLALIYSSSSFFDWIKSSLDLFLVPLTIYTPIWNFYVLFGSFILIVVIVFGVSGLFYSRTSAKSKDCLWNSYMFSTFLVFYLWTSPAILNNCLRSIFWLRTSSDPEHPCDVNLYTPSLSSDDPSLLPVKITSWIILFFITLVIPIGSTIPIRLNRNAPFNKNFFIRFSYYYREFKEEFYFFEIFRMYTKMLMSFLAAQNFLDNEMKLLLLFLALNIYYLLVLRLKPYKQGILNRFERETWVVLIITFIGNLVVIHSREAEPGLSIFNWEMRGSSYYWLEVSALLIIFLANSIYFYNALGLLLFSVKKRSWLERGGEFLQRVWGRIRRVIFRKKWKGRVLGEFREPEETKGVSLIIDPVKHQDF